MRIKNAMSCARLEYAALECEAAVMEQYIDDVSSVAQVIVKSDL